MHHHIGRGDLVGQDRIHAIVERQFVIRKRQAGEEPAFDEEIITDRKRAEKIALGELLLLLIAAEQEEHFGLKGVGVAVGIKTRQKRVFLEDLEHRIALVALGYQVDERGLSYPDGAFDDDITRGTGVEIGHGYRGGSKGNNKTVYAQVGVARGLGLGQYRRSKFRGFSAIFRLNSHRMPRRQIVLAGELASTKQIIWLPSPVRSSKWMRIALA